MLPVLFIILYDIKIIKVHVKLKNTILKYFKISNKYKQLICNVLPSVKYIPQTYSFPQEIKSLIPVLKQKASFGTF